jgi:4'-phosphopantetheinyl transferase
MMRSVAPAVRVAPAGAGELEVWRVRLQHSPAALEKGMLSLGERERQRAARYRHSADRSRYVLGRATLRRLLCARLRVPNEALVFGENAFGKPLLLEPSADLQFNSSHSGEWIVHALHTHAPVGLDVEQVRADFADWHHFAGVLTPEEASRIASLPHSHRAVALARTWTRKEAYLKALGQGISRSPARISIEVDAAGRPRLSYDRNVPRVENAWRFRDIPIDADHAACVVWRSGDDEPDRTTAPVIRDLGL